MIAPSGGWTNWISERLQRRSFCLLLALLAFLIAVSLHWRWLQVYRILDLPPRWDEATYHTRAVWYFNSIRDGGANSFWEAFSAPDEPRPPLLPLSTLLLYPLGPYQIWFGHLVILAYLGLLVACIYFISEHLTGPENGFFSVLYLLVFPSIIVYSRAFLSDLPTAALVSLAILCLLKSDQFKKWVWTVVLGITIGLAMNMRTFAGVYVILPLLFAFYRGLRTHGLRILLRVVPASCIALLVMWPWYGTHVDALIGFLTKYTYGEFSTIHAGADPSGFFTPTETQLPPLFYLRVLFFSGPSILFGVPLLILLVLGISRGRWRWRNMATGHVLILLWVLGSFLILSSISNISQNYATPILPALAVLIEYAVRSSGIARAFRIYAAIAILSIAIPYSNGLIGIELGDTLRRIYPDAADRVPINPDWQMPNVLSAIEQRSLHQTTYIAFIASHPFYSGNVLRLEIKERGLPYSVTEPILDRDSLIRKCLISNDYLVAKTGLQLPPSAAIDVERLRTFFDDGYFRYEQLPLSLPLPDRSAVRVFKHLPYYVSRPVFDPSPTVRVREIPPTRTMIQGTLVRPVSVVFNQRIEFLGAYLHNRLGIWFLRCFWRILASPGTDLRCFVHFLDDESRAVAQGDHDPAGAGSTKYWKAGELVAEASQLRGLTNPESIATAGIGLNFEGSFDRFQVTSSSLPFDEEDTRLLLPRDQMNWSPPKELRGNVGAERVRAPANFGDFAVLASCQVGRDASGMPIARYVWRCIGIVPQDYLFFVHFTDAAGRIQFQDDHVLFDGSHPTSRWRPGDWMVELRRLDPPQGKKPEEMDMRIGAESIDGSARYLPVLGEGAKSDWSGKRLVLHPPGPVNR